MKLFESKFWNNFHNLLFIVALSFFVCVSLAFIMAYSSDFANAQVVHISDKTVYGSNIPPSLEGISLGDDVDSVLNTFRSKYIFERYLRRSNHQTFIDPYLIYSQRYYTQYYNSFIPVTLCDGKEYLIKFDEINFSNKSYQMYKESGGNYYAVYNELFGLFLKDKETIHRLNADLESQLGIRFDFYRGRVYRIVAYYSFDLDEISEMLDEYRWVYGEPLTYSIEDDGEVFSWSAKDNLIRLTITKDILDMLSFVDIHRGERVFNNNKIKIELLSSSVNSEIIRYKSDIYMDIVRNLSYEYKNKVDSMNYYLCGD